MKRNKTTYILISLIIICSLTSCGQGADSTDTSKSLSSKNESITEYDTIYDDFTKSNEWRKVTQEEKTFEVESVEIESHKIYDFDGDGIPELWFLAKTLDYDSNGGEELSGFCTIVDNKVKALLQGYKSGGTIGGNSIDIRFDKETSQHVIGRIGHVGGFGGNESWAEYYSFSSSTLKPIVNISQISQIDEQYEETELQDPDLYYVEKENPFESSSDGDYITIYKVDDKQVPIEDFNKVKNRFVEPD